MKIQCSTVGGLVGLILGSGLYMAQGQAATLSVEVGKGKYVLCNTEKDYEPQNFCHDHVRAYNAQYKKEESSSSSSRPSYTPSAFQESAAERMQARQEAAAARREAASKGHWVCPKKN